ncbi:hypothetical protein F2P81_003050 [Scophthalmus maximus]|uniref:Papilin-like n=1 Tax=Scophthalmus maximus TaxID=52904 RepID=A0A6A4TPH5_SCOMX|nr:hypothetical protein F2P81_003050 [Scophthalmus maximus]
MLYYQRGAEGDNVPETLIGRGPTTEPLVVELISQEPNQGVEYEFYLPNGRSREGYYWSFGSWSSCSRECGSGYQSRLVFCTVDNEAYPDYLCASLPRPQTNRTCNPHPCPGVRSWNTGEWNACSVTCGGGSQVRSVRCISHDAAGPRVVEDAVCAAYAEAPPTLQTCNMHKCAEYRVAGWSACSATCGPGQQTRGVTCVGSGGQRLEEASCGTLLRPPAVQPCEVAACPKQISWHVGEWGLCTKSCGSGSRERQVICSDRERNLYPVHQCGAHPKPSAVERCNRQACYSPQDVPSVQHPQGHDNTQTGFRPFVPNDTAVERSICSLPRGAGSCSSWVPRYHFDVITSQCAHFWYGGCHGNSNNFVTWAECQSACQQGPQPPVAPAGGPASRRESAPARGAGAGGSTAGGSTGGQSRNMGRIFTVQGGSTGATGRQATSAAANAHRGRFYLRGRRPAPVTAAQHSSPAARHHQQPNGSLLVGPLTKSDSGWFLCVATRERERDHRYIYLSVSEGSSQLIPTSLPRDGPFPRFSIDRSSPSLLEMRAGQTARLPCVVVPPSALQSVSVQWTKDGQTLSGSRFTQRSDGTLTFGGLRSEDSGVYTCTASSRQQLEQRQLQLRVQADLKITTAPNNIQVSEGRTALLPCVVSGDNINIRWSRNGVPVRPDGRDILLSSDGSLVLNRVKPSDEGTYTCNAYTGIYSVSATAEVRVIKDSQRGVDVPPECVDQPELANCELIVYARLCSNSYYSSFCCASCTRHSQKSDRPGRLG